MSISYRVIRSKRKTLSLEIKSDGSLLVRAPRRLSARIIEAFVLSRESWIREKLQKYENRPLLPRLTEEELEQMA